MNFFSIDNYKDFHLRPFHQEKIQFDSQFETGNMGRVEFKPKVADASIRTLSQAAVGFHVQMA